MKLVELEREVELLPPDEQRKLMGFLVAMEVQRDELDRLSSRLDDQDSGNWISLKDAEARLKDGV